MDEAAAYRLVIEARITELWTRRAWYRSHLGWIIAQRVEDMTELRTLVRLAREARRIAALERHDAVTASKAWSESELAAAWGR